jgi:hypothetical protein
MIRLCHSVPGLRGLFGVVLFVVVGCTSEPGGGLARQALELPSHSSWETKAPLPQASGHFGSGEVVDGKLHVAGGLTNFAPTAAHYVYDPAFVFGWYEAAPMNVARVAYGSGVLDGKIYALLGTSGPTLLSAPRTDADVYNPGSNAWTLLTPSGLARSSCASGL